MGAEANIREFMSRVVPWPTDGHGYVNLHWRALNPHEPTKPEASFWSGKPTKTPDDFIAMTKWAANKPNIRDLYYCLSLQSSVKVNERGRPGVARNKANALALKAIWLDIDIKEPPKGYATLEDAIDALGAFMKEYGLPPFSALVASGGGLHVYWISNDPLEPSEWRPYAEGLKAAALKFGLHCDAGVSTDEARILRVPGTANFKTTPPKPVQLLRLLSDYDFPTSLGMLRDMSGPVTATVKSVLVGAPASVFAVLDPKESLAAGIERQDTPLAWEPIIPQCGFFRDAIKTGGKDYSQPMWNLSTLMATFLENGHALAHKMGNKHPGYTQESTEKMWERKVKERQERGLGWPSCSAIQSAGCGACASCPHLAEGKSPLNLTGPASPPPPPPGSPPSGSPPIPQPLSALMLPKGYGLNPDGVICLLREERGEKGQAPTTSYVPLFYGKLSLPWAQEDPPALNFTTTADKGRTKAVSIPQEMIMNSTEMWKTLQRQGVKPTPYRKQAEEFLMAWLSKIHDAQRAQVALPFGWWTDKGKRHGFSFGGLIMKDDGTEGPAGFGDSKLRMYYQPVGDLQPWYDACKLITDQHRPELDILVASAFAAPLLVTPAEYSVLLSVWGDSGAGKSTAVKVASSVWGHPKKSKEVTLTTARSIIAKMGSLKNIPIYWDEIKNKKAQAAVFDTFFTSSEGVGPGRLTSNIEQRDKDDWQTILCICSNINFLDYVVQAQPTTDAGMYRVFEYDIRKAPAGSAGQIRSMQASRITQELENNYGMMGMKYAKLLGSDPAAIDQFVESVCNKFYDDVGATTEERNWSALCGVLIAGGELANQLGASLDVPAMRDFLIDAYAKNRARWKEEATQGGTRTNTEEKLTSFLKEVTQEQVWTDTFVTGVGKPAAVNVIFAPNLFQPRPTQVQWAIKERLLRISRQRFVDYLTKAEIPVQQVFNGLKTHFNMTLAEGRLAAGTPFRCTRERVIQIPIPPGSPLEDQLFAHSSAEDRTKAEAEKAAEPTLPPEDEPASLTEAITQAQKDFSKARDDT